MKIAVVATYDVTNINNWSGLAFYIYEILARNFDVTPITIDFKRPIRSWIKGFYYNRVLKKHYFVTFDKSVYRKSRKSIKEKLGSKYDVILTFDYFLIPAIASYAKDVVLFTDATFDNLLNYYEYRTNLCPSNIRDGHTLQKEAFELLTDAFLTSAWARNNAITRYGARPERLIDIKYGSNLTLSLAASELETVIGNRSHDDVVRLFFPMVYWDRKGGEYVMAIVKKMNAMGQKCELTIAGRMPDNVDRKYVHFLGYLDKKKPENEQILLDAYKHNHFLIMPSKADCTPVVFAEANSCALPVISTKTGGIESVVNGTFDNGVTFLLDETYVDHVVEYIIATFNSKDRYKELCTHSYDAYNSYFKWSNCEKILVNTIKSLEH